VLDWMMVSACKFAGDASKIERSLQQPRVTGWFNSALTAFRLVSIPQNLGLGFRVRPSLAER